MCFVARSIVNTNSTFTTKEIGEICHRRHQSRHYNKKKMERASRNSLPFELTTKLVEHYLEDMIMNLRFSSTFPCARPRATGGYMGVCMRTIGDIEAGDLVAVISDEPSSHWSVFLDDQLGESIAAIIRSRLDSISAVLVATAVRMLNYRTKLLSNSNTLKPRVVMHWQPEIRDLYPWTKTHIECYILDELTGKAKLSQMLKRIKEREARWAGWMEAVEDGRGRRKGGRERYRESS